MRPQVLRLYLSEYRKRRRKTALITFAIAWGVLSLLLLMAFGRGLSNSFRDSFKGLGDNLIIISGGQTSMIHMGLPKGRRIRLYPDDVDLIRLKIPEISLISPESFTRFFISYNGRETNRLVNGVAPAFARMRNQIPQMGGRFINPDDVRLARRVAFVGWNVAEDLFPDENPVGKRVTINRVPFRVIGVMKRKLQSSSYEGLDYDQVYIPFSTFTQIYSQRFMDRFHVRPGKRGYSRFVEKRIREILGKKYRFAADDEYAINVWNTIRQAETAGKVFFGIEIFLAVMGGLTLMIGAVGVTNLMYAVVKERTREVGVKMALGAKRRHVVQQFLLEAFLIFLKGMAWGGLIAFNLVGLVRSIPISYDISSGILSYLVRPEFSWDALILFFCVMGVLVFLSGIFPAMRASRLNPVEALRYE